MGRGESEDELGHNDTTLTVKSSPYSDVHSSARRPRRQPITAPSPMIHPHNPVQHVILRKTTMQSPATSSLTVYALQSDVDDHDVDQDENLDSDSSDAESTSSHLSDQPASIEHEIKLLGLANSQLEEHLTAVHAQAASVEASIERAITLARQRLTIVADQAKEAESSHTAQSKQYEDIAGTIESEEADLEALKEGCAELSERWQKHPVLLQQNQDFFRAKQRECEKKQKEIFQLRGQLKQVSSTKKLYLEKQEEYRHTIISAQKDVAHYGERQAEIKAGIMLLYKEHISRLQGLSSEDKVLQQEDDLDPKSRRKRKKGPEAPRRRSGRSTKKKVELASG